METEAAAEAAAVDMSAMRTAVAAAVAAPAAAAADAAAAPYIQECPEVEIENYESHQRRVMRGTSICILLLHPLGIQDGRSAFVESSNLYLWASLSS